MGQAKRRREALGSAYGTPEASNAQARLDAAALRSISRALADGVPVLLLGTRAAAAPLACPGSMKSPQVLRCPQLWPGTGRRIRCPPQASAPTGWWWWELEVRACSTAPCSLDYLTALAEAQREIR